MEGDLQPSGCICKTRDPGIPVEPPELLPPPVLRAVRKQLHAVNKRGLGLLLCMCPRACFDFFGQDLLDEYFIRGTCGVPGSFGCVFECERRRDGNLFAVKMIHVERQKAVDADLSQLENEIAVLRRIQTDESLSSHKSRHPNIAGLENIRLNSDSTTVMLEMTLTPKAMCQSLYNGLVPTRDLFDAVACGYFKDPATQEDRAQRIMAQVVSGLWFLHTRKPAIVHRDIKTENILLTMTDNDSQEVGAMLIDFGLVANAGDHHDQSTLGTASYKAPELNNARVYDVASDCYSLGATLAYMIMHKVNPVAQLAHPRQPRLLTKGHPCRDVVDRLLDPNPATRMTVGELANHAWLQPAIRSLIQRDAAQQILWDGEKLSHPPGKPATTVQVQKGVTLDAIQEFQSLTARSLHNLQQNLLLSALFACKMKPGKVSAKERELRLATKHYHLSRLFYFYSMEYEKADEEMGLYLEAKGQDPTDLFAAMNLRQQIWLQLLRADRRDNGSEDSPKALALVEKIRLEYQEIERQAQLIPEAPMKVVHFCAYRNAQFLADEGRITKAEAIQLMERVVEQMCAEDPVGNQEDILVIETTRLKFYSHLCMQELKESLGKFRDLVASLRSIYQARVAMHAPVVGHRHVIQSAKYLARVLLEHHNTYEHPEDLEMYREADALLTQAKRWQRAYRGEDSFYEELNKLARFCSSQLSKLEQPLRCSLPAPAGRRDSEQELFLVTAFASLGDRCGSSPKDLRKAFLELVQRDLKTSLDFDACFEPTLQRLVKKGLVTRVRSGCFKLVQND